MAREDEIPPAGWSKHDDRLEAEFVFSTFAEAIAFVNRVAEQADSMNHHPDIDIRYNRVQLVLTTHDAGGLTPLDYDLAGRISRTAG